LNVGEWFSPASVWLYHGYENGQMTTALSSCIIGTVWENYVGS